MKPLTAVCLLAITAPLVDAATYQEALTSRFAAWDQNKDMQLSLAEADAAIASLDNKGDHASSAVAIRRTLKKKKTTSTTLADAIADKDGAMFYAAAQKRIATATRTLFVTQPPNPQLIRQGKSGDCFCLAALRTILQRSPAEAMNMIRPNPNGSYAVQIGDKVITTPAPTDGEIALGANTADGLWIVVYEKAVGISRIKPESKDATPFNIVTKGGSAGSMMSTLSRSPIQRWSCKTWREAKNDPASQTQLLSNLRRQLAEACKESRLITGGTDSPPKNAPRPPGILFGHGYAILGYDKATDKVHLWNPHGDDFTPKGPEGPQNGYTMHQGESHIPLTELITFFGGFAFQQKAN